MSPQAALFGPVKGRKSLLRYFYFSSGGHFVLRSRTVCAIWIVGILRNISVKYYLKLGPVIQEEMSFKYISILALMAILFIGAKGFGKFGRGHYERRRLNVV